MRNLYAERLATLMEGSKQHLDGLLEISNLRADLYMIGYPDLFAPEPESKLPMAPTLKPDAKMNLALPDLRSL
jgi:hypothetical protein